MYRWLCYFNVCRVNWDEYMRMPLLQTWEDWNWLLRVKQAEGNAAKGRT